MPFQNIVVGHIEKDEVELIHNYPECYYLDFIISHVNHHILILSKKDFPQYSYLSSITFIIYDPFDESEDQLFKGDGSYKTNPIPCFKTLDSCLRFAENIHPEKTIFTLENDIFENNTKDNDHVEINRGLSFMMHPQCSNVYIVNFADPFPHSVNDIFHPDKKISSHYLKFTDIYVSIPDAYHWTFDQTIHQDNQVEIIQFKKRIESFKI